MSDTARVKIAVGVVLCGLLLAGCSSNGGHPSSLGSVYTPAAASTAASNTPAAAPAESCKQFTSSSPNGTSTSAVADVKPVLQAIRVERNVAKADPAKEQALVDALMQPLTDETYAFCLDDSGSTVLAEVTKQVNKYPTLYLV